MDFFMTAVAERVGLHSALRKVGALMDWQHLAAVLGLDSVVTRYRPRAPDTGSAPRQETMRHSWRIAWQFHASA